MSRGVLRAKVSAKVSVWYVTLWYDVKYRFLSQCRSQRCTEQMGRGE